MHIDAEWLIVDSVAYVASNTEAVGLLRGAVLRWYWCATTQSHL